MLTLLLGKTAKSFRISHQEMIKGVRTGGVGPTLAYFNTLEVPIIENTAREEDLTESMAKAMEEYPHAAAILVRRHGVYVWGESWWSGGGSWVVVTCDREGAAVRDNVVGYPTRLVFCRSPNRAHTLATKRP